MDGMKLVVVKKPRFAVWISILYVR